MDKYQLIDSIVIQVDALVDMRGTDKCRAVLEIVSKLAALKAGLKNDDAENDERIKALEHGKGLK